MSFPPQSLYPVVIDSDYTLFLVYDTAETTITANNQPWSDEIPIKARSASQSEIWANNGFATISGELLYYDAVDKDSNGKVVNLKRCARNIGGNHTQYNSSGTWIRGFVIAEHHNQLVDALINIEDFIGVNNSTDVASLDYRIRSLQKTPDIFDDYGCADVTFTFTIIKQDQSGTLVNYSLDITGNASFTLNFGDGTSTSIAQSGQHLYPPNANIDPVVILNTDKCTKIQTPITRTSLKEPTGSTAIAPFTIQVPLSPSIPQIVIPSLTVPSLDVFIPPIVFPCISVGNFSGNINIPSIITFTPQINIPSFITFGPVNIPSIITTAATISVVNLISFTNVPQFSTIQFGPLPSFPIIQFGSVNVPSIIQFGAVNIPSLVNFGPVPSFPIIQFGNIPSFPIIQFGSIPSFVVQFGNVQFGNLPSFPTIQFGPVPSFGTIQFGSVPSFPTIQFGPVPSFGTIQFGPAPSFTNIQFGPAPSIVVQFGPAPSFPTIQFGAVPSFPTIQFGTVPSFPTIQFGSLPSFPAIQFASPPTIPAIQFGAPPTINVNWGTIPVISCACVITCPGSTPFAMAPPVLDGEMPFFEQDNSLGNMAVEYDLVGFPSEIKIVAPKIDPIRVEHELPSVIRFDVPKINDIKIIGPEFPLPTEIKIIPPKKEELLNVIEFKLPEKIVLDSSSIPQSLRVEFPSEIPHIKLDASEIPSVIQVIGLPSVIEVVGMPDRIKVEVPSDVRIPVFFDGPPISVTVNLETQKLIGDQENLPCFAFLPCGTVKKPI